ncbi:hypothetical protein BMS3Abin14_00697 [bacterium BMS3Abin14]|nr:hypothetical protein BMS3Abin14_00697 [bacterium BMS3Abin14]
MHSPQFLRQGQAANHVAQANRSVPVASDDGPPCPLAGGLLANIGIEFKEVGMFSQETDHIGDIGIPRGGFQPGV